MKNRGVGVGGVGWGKDGTLAKTGTIGTLARGGNCNSNRGLGYILICKNNKRTQTS